MARRRLSPFETLWRRHIFLYSEVFSEALQELSESASISGNEDAISEILCPILNRVCFSFGKSRNQELQTPFWEAPIQPVTNDELKGGKIKKRPDFTCKLINPWADTHENYEIAFHVESKLLGNPTSANWILNKNYVKNGIKRFDSEIHEYGKRAYSGMMIGYIISMAPEEIESQVNGYQKIHAPENTEIKFLFDTTTLFKTRQDIKRKNVMPARFELIHLWVDLRNCYKNLELELGPHTSEVSLPLCK
jgi:hypothetical protein